jgi:uncharacterized membrane protein
VLDKLLPGASQLQNYHPLIVHFPIAFIYGAALMYFLASILASENLKWTALWMLAFGALGAAAAVLSGFYAAPGLMVSESVRHELLRHHKQLMVTASAITLALTLWAIATRPMPTRGRYVFLAGLIAVLCLITAGADLGGEMVFSYNAGGSACAQPIDFRKP